MHLFRSASKRTFPAILGFRCKLGVSTVAIAGMFAIAPSVFAASRSAAALNPINVRAISMKTSRVGWAVTQTSIVRTVDGGRRWADVSPPIPLYTASSPYQHLNTVWDFLNTRSAWVVATKNHTHQVECSYTHDGGARWKTFTSTILPVNRTFDRLYEADFLNSRDGWLVLGPTGVAGVGQLYATRNGGQSWHHLVPNTPLVGVVSFNTANTGRMLISEPDNGRGPLFAIESTQNGGQDWTPSTIKSMNGLELVSSVGPGFGMTTKGAHGLLSVSSVGTARNPYVAVLRSADGGQRWVARSPIVPVNPQDFWSAQTIGSQVAWVAASGRLWQSTNGARSWSYRSSDAFLGHATGLDFVNAQVGWVWKTTAIGTHLWMTATGGRRWTTWSFHVTP